MQHTRNDPNKDRDPQTQSGAGNHPWDRDNQLDVLPPKDRARSFDSGAHHSTHSRETTQERRQRSERERRVKRGKKLAAGVATGFGSVLLAVSIVLFMLIYALFTSGVRGQYSATYDLMATQLAAITQKVDPLAAQGGYTAKPVIRAISPESIMQFSRERVDWIWNQVLNNVDDGEPVWDDAAIRQALMADDAFTAKHTDDQEQAVSEQSALVAKAVTESIMPIQTMADNLLLFMGNFISHNHIVTWIIVGAVVCLILGLACLLTPIYALRKYKPYPDLFIGCGLIGVGIILEVAQWVLSQELISRIIDAFGAQIQYVLGACIAWITDTAAIGGLIVLLLGLACIAIFYTRRYQIKHFTHHELSSHRF